MVNVHYGLSCFKDCVVIYLVYCKSIKIKRRNQEFEVDINILIALVKGRSIIVIFAFDEVL